jgi:hypothetical protein
LKYYYLKCTNFMGRNRKETGDKMKKGSRGMGCEGGR